MSKTLTIFEYNGAIGATSDIENGTFLNDVKGSGQLGVVVHTDDVQITQGAKDVLKTCPKEGGSFAEIMLTKHADGSGHSVGIMGFHKHISAEPMLGRTCSREALDHIDLVEMDIDPEFISAVNESKARNGP